MTSILEVQTAGLLETKTHPYGCQEETWSRNWKWNDWAQDQVLQTQYSATKILQTETDSKCRLSQQLDKTIDIISGCPIFTKEQYIKKHDTVYTKLQFNIRKEMGVKLDSEHWYQHVPKSIQTSHGDMVITLWNQTGANQQNHP
jgi:hypothetical protein